MEGCEVLEIAGKLARKKVAVISWPRGRQKEEHGCREAVVGLFLPAGGCRVKEKAPSLGFAGKEKGRGARLCG